MDRIHHGPNAILHPTLAQSVNHTIKRVVFRTRNYGLHSGWICLKTHLHNFALRAMNRFFPNPRRSCPCCGWKGRDFRALDIGVVMFSQIECPGCLCHDRHRMIHLFLERHPCDFLQGSKRILHFAPEPHILKFMLNNPELKSISTDIEPLQLSWGLRPYVFMDLHDLAMKDNCIDGIFIMHVLEHVQDDRKALSEMLRIMKPGGQAVIMVPIDPSITKTEEWGKPNPEIFDHYRNYAVQDFPEKLKDFEVEVVLPSDLCTPEEIDRFKIRATEIVFCCTKPTK